jgi:hypothetical protein
MVHTKAQAKYLHTHRDKGNHKYWENLRGVVDGRGVLYIEEAEAELGMGGVEVEEAVPRSMPSRRGPPPRPF